MRSAAFDYFAPNTLDEAIAQLAEHGPDARILAGGQSLIPAMNLRLAQPPVVIDLANVPGLANIEQSGDVVTIGARTTHAEIAASPVLQKALPMLPFMAQYIGHAAIRQRGTFGGSLANADPASEWPCALLALDGRVEAISPRGERTIPSHDFFRSYFTTALEPDEILTRVVLPVHGAGHNWSFQEVARQSGAFGLVLVLACGTLSSDGTVADLRIAVGGCGACPLLPTDGCSGLIGLRPSIASVEKIAKRIAAGLDPMGDSNASGEDRRQIAATLVRRTLTDVFGLERQGARR